MSSHYPCIRREENMLEVLLDDPAKRLETKIIGMVIDLDRTGLILAIEIINLIFHVGPSCLGVLWKTVPTIATMASDLRFGYDQEVDCFYLRLANGRSSTQESVEGQIYLNSGGQIIGIEVRKSE